jgi:uncharacterized protein
MKPPSPYASVDLYKAVKRAFNFDSNRLAFLVEELHIGAKRKENHSLWDKLDEGSAHARAEMRRYNMQDVRITAELYERLKPWINGHPNVGTFAGDDLPRCPTCGSERMTRRGTYVTKAGTSYQRLVCGPCGKWSRDSKRQATTPLRAFSMKRARKLIVCGSRRRHVYGSLR